MVELLLEPRSLYILSGGARYEYTHEILPQAEDSLFEGQKVDRGRRISLIFRDDLSDPNSPKQPHGGYAHPPST